MIKFAVAWLVLLLAVELIVWHQGLMFWAGFGAGLIIFQLYTIIMLVRNLRRSPTT